MELDDIKLIKSNIQHKARMQQHFEEIQGKKVKTKDFNSAKLSFKVIDKQYKTSKNSSNVTFRSSSPKNKEN